MTHRGGIAADGKTGDGCGLLMKKNLKVTTALLPRKQAGSSLENTPWA